MNYYNCSIAGESFSRFIEASSAWSAAEAYARWCDENTDVTEARVIIVRLTSNEWSFYVKSAIVREYDAITL